MHASSENELRKLLARLREQGDEASGGEGYGLRAAAYQLEQVLDAVFANERTLSQSN